MVIGIIEIVGILGIGVYQFWKLRGIILGGGGEYYSRNDYC